MWRLRCWKYLLLLALTLAPVQRVSACTCLLQHPQMHFCNSDFVAVVKVKKVNVLNEYETAYKVKINKLFKTTEKADYALKQNLLWTPSVSAMCGAILDVGETYVVSGRIITGKPEISICELSMRWADVTSRQRKGFRRLYHRGCLCEIQYTPWWRKGAVLESAGGKRCLWESSPGPEACQEKYGVCMAGPAGCSWVPSVPYKNCIAEYQRERELQRAREP